MDKARGSYSLPRTHQGDILQFGTEEGRGISLAVIARSKVTMRFTSIELFWAGMRHLREFASVLRTRKQADLLYGWSRLFVSQDEREVRFEILWYDESFHQRRRFAYRSAFHREIFARMGIDASSVYVEDVPNSGAEA